MADAVGAILLWRKLEDSALYNKACWVRVLFIHLLLNARRFPKNGLDVGQLHTTARGIISKANLGKDKVTEKMLYKELDWLKKNGMLGKKGTKDGMVITICNYREYQVYRLADNVAVGENKGKIKGNEIKEKVKGKIEKTKTIVAVAPCRFDEFWALYPRKLGKAKAKKNWDTRIKQGESADDLILASGHYAMTRVGEPDKFTKHAQTFLGPNKEWLDFLETPIPQSKPNLSPKQVAHKAFDFIARKNSDGTNSFANMTGGIWAVRIVGDDAIPYILKKLKKDKIDINDYFSKGWNRVDFAERYVAYISNPMEVDTVIDFSQTGYEPLEWRMAYG